MKSKKKSTTSDTAKTDNPKGSTRQLGSTEKLLIRHGIPVTRTNWIDLAYMGEPPKEWTREHEMELPPHLRDKSKLG
jgi:hypothetical protein